MTEKTKAEAIRTVVTVCQALEKNTEACSRKISAFLDFFLTGIGQEPRREDWPDRVLNPKLNGTSGLLKQLRTALGAFLPQTLPETCVTALNDFVTSATSFVETLENFYRTESLGVSYTTESDIFSYMTTRFGPMTWEKHRDNLKAKFAAMKQSFYDNAKAAYNLTDRIVRSSPHYHPVKTHMRALSEAFRRHEAAAAMPPAIGSGQSLITLPQAEMLLREKCARANLLDFAVCERTFRRWERDQRGPAGYTRACRASVQAFLAWVDGYLVTCRTHATGKLALVHFEESCFQAACKITPRMSTH